MRVIALEEAFAYPPIREAGPDVLGQLKGHPELSDIQRKLEDLGDARLTDMDSAQIDVQVISHTIPGPEMLAPAEAVPLAPAANDALAAAISARPDRFAGLATLPMTDPKRGAEELERAVRQLGFRGALVNGLIEGHFLDILYFHRF